MQLNRCSKKKPINDFSIIRPVNTEHLSFLLKVNVLEECLYYAKAIISIGIDFRLIIIKSFYQAHASVYSCNMPDGK